MYVDGGMSDQLLTVTEVAERLRISKMTIYRWIDEGRLPAMQFGKQFRVRAADLDAIVAGAQVAVDRADPWAGEPPAGPNVG